MDELLDSLGGPALKGQLIFIIDGATWIHQWSKDLFPQAIHILNYYHATEHLHESRRAYFRKTQAGKQWAQHVLNLRVFYMNGQWKRVIDNIKNAAELAGRATSSKLAA